METFWQDAGDIALRVGARVLLGALLLFVGFRIARWLTRSIQQAHVHRHGGDPLSPTTRSFLASAAGIVLRIAVVVLFIIVMGANVSSVVAMLSSAALAIGLALQNSFSNLAGGLLIILFKPFSIGDYITVGTESGTVQVINIYFTHILTPDNRTVVLPNGLRVQHRPGQRLHGADAPCGGRPAGGVRGGFPPRVRAAGAGRRRGRARARRPAAARRADGSDRRRADLHPVGLVRARRLL